MSKDAGKLVCDCGCGVPEFLNKLKTVEIEQALDESLRSTIVSRRFLVRSECEKDFIHELQAKRVLEDIVRRYKSRHSSVFLRVLRVRNVMRLQHVVNIRNMGAERTVKKVRRTGILFLSPHWLAGWLDLHWRKKDQTKARQS